MNRTDTFYAIDEALTGYGAQWEVGNGATPTEVFQAVAAVVSITPGAMNTADIVRTHLRSPDAHHEHMPGMRDSGAFQMLLRWLPEDESQSNVGGGTGPFIDGGVIAKWRERSIDNHRIVIYHNGTPTVTWPFRGYIAQFQPGVLGIGDVPVDATVSVMPTEAYDADLP